jgi:hypothetical protein
MTWSTVAPSLITAAVAFAGIGFGSRLSGRRETLNWTRDQRLKAYTELLTAIDNCYDAFGKIAAIMSLRNYPAKVPDDPNLSGAIDDWRKWYDEIDRRLPFADLVSSERFIEYRSRIKPGWRSRQMALINNIKLGTPTQPEEWESVHRKTIGGQASIQHTLRADLTRIDSNWQRMSDRLWPLRRQLRRIRRGSV